MSDVERDSKTEDASQRRREQARAEGQVAYSPDLSTGFVLLMFGMALWLGGSWLGQSLLDSFRQTLGGVSTNNWSIADASLAGRWLMGSTWNTVGLLVALLLVASVGAGVLQSGVHLSTEALSLNFERLLPTRGWSRLFSAEAGGKVLSACAKIALSCAVVWMVVRNDWDLLAGSGRVNVRHAVLTTWSIGVWLLLVLGGCALAIGAADYAFQWWRHEQNLKMSKQEVKQEQKEENGDPHVRAHRRRMQREMRKPRGFKNVAAATVVLKNPTHYAVAIQYDPNSMAAPKVVAKGSGPHARRILRLAEQHNVPVLERKPLARALYKMVDIGKEIPVELYQAMAEILATVYKTKRAA